ncbi:phytoene desaturase family protein [Chitinophaga sancti]|uniref:NAD(P)/FAD-dependent oxidoreductase n=1 Tax=Chitinophaga sancti TaxID=1004 RepID=A0A1K1SP02_9BACT|nr:NAD(P)/FAD-dependent oxidoreductase [Chitinophaga sancti]WQD60096.1 NAD(P)/FAD-dependent oxidoreductase [Chitinophaga sancti]WQG87776.1 NAD(P)/FAD-dependent oxidoreductase [Chitinophaga sancti]SFW85613.1 Phytoene dehydrogenase-related protein [Chitinophaga sancti]
MNKQAYDAIVVGAGPNGLSAAITLQQRGIQVLLLEGKDTIGGGLRSKALTLPGFVHDVCSAIHPLAAGSPFFRTLPLADYGLKFLQPELAAAHPFDDGTAAVLHRSLDETAKGLGIDERAYHQLMDPVVRDWPLLAPALLGPLSIPKHPLAMARFGLKALLPAKMLAARFQGKTARGLFAGMAAHCIQPLSNLTTAAIGMVLLANGHLEGWPAPQGGAQAIANALAAYFESIGGEIQTNTYIRSLNDLPSARAILLDLTPKQLLEIAGDKLKGLYKYQLQHYRYGMGVFKVDWALDGPIPFTNENCRKAGTVHLGNTLEEITLSEQISSKGLYPEKPFVLLAQQSIFDPSRAPEGKHTAWAYCHVPHGSTVDMTAHIENQVERFAPGFRDLIIGRHTMNTREMEAYNPNYIGGDINGGILDITQLYTRPAIRLSPYSTPAKGIYICSSATPPGGGVHGMCGHHAAKKALKDIFKIH